VKSNKVLFWLVAVAAVVWGYNFFRIADYGLDEDAVCSERGKTDAFGRVSEFRKISRDPFDPLVSYAKAQPQIQSARIGTRSIAATQPQKSGRRAIQIRLNGIMWDPVKPMAVLELPGGTTQMVSPGQAIEGLIVEAISRQEVTLSDHGQKIIIK